MASPFDHDSQQRPDPPKRNRGGLIGILAAIGAVLAKFAVPLLIVLKSGGTMFLSILAYTWAFGWNWQMATCLVALIFVHEMGHIIAAKFYGIEVSAPMFIPLMGAYVTLKNRPLDAWMDYVISYAGPLAGGLGGWVAFFLGVQLGHPWLYLVAFYTFILNLFNLIPIPGLDGSFIWIAFNRNITPDMSTEDRFYAAAFLFLLLAGLILGCVEATQHLNH